MPVTITPRERTHLKARAHALEPVVKIGERGVTDGVVAEIDRALRAHELIKVRAGGATRDARAALVAAITGRTDATLVQSVGKVMVLWRPRPEAEAAAALPAERRQRIALR
jgi:putative YhbY family RNA-binding protein